MSGSGSGSSAMDIVLDTNAVIALLEDRSQSVLDILDRSDWAGISVITRLEFLCHRSVQHRRRCWTSC